MKKQKFFRGHQVRISKDLPTYMRHFKNDFVAVVNHSYTDIHGSSSEREPQYSITYKKEDGTFNSSAWYQESLLTLVDGDRDKGEAFLQEAKGE